MEHRIPQNPENEYLTVRFSFDDDVSSHSAASDRTTNEDHVVSDISSESPSSEYHPSTQEIPPNASANKAPNSTMTSVSAKSATRRRHAHLLRNWWLEIGACFIFILALIAIVITLRPHQGKPLPQWPYNISINSLISVYVVVLKATVLLVTAEGIGQLKWRWFQNDRSLKDMSTYDAASRGPLGSFLLLWTLGLRHPLSSCGAVITILMLAIDPFAQQIIRYQGCIVTVDGPQVRASIPRTNYFAPNGGLVGAGQVSIGAELQSAVNAGIFFPGSLVNTLCSTGNCTFPHQYDTLGYCGECTDITDSLTFVEREDSPDLAGYARPRNSTVSYLPSGLSINSTNPVVLTSNSHAGGTVPKGYNLATMGSTFFTEDGNSASSQVAEIILAKSPYTERSPGQQTQAFNETCQNGNSSWHCLGYGAARCTLNPCVRTYEGSITSGVFQENLVSQTDDTSIWALGQFNELQGRQSFSMATIDTKCISLDEQDSLVAAGYRIDPAKRWLPYNLTLDPSIESNSSFPSSMLQKDCVYVVDAWTVGSLWSQYLARFFNGTINGSTSVYGVIDLYTGPQNLQTIYDFGNITLESVDSVFQNISDSLTTYIRQSGNENHSTPVTGIVLHDDTCLEVRWGWLVLPAVLVLVTVLFFAVTLIVTRPTRDRAEVWKSSPLALIFHGLEAQNLVQGNSALQEIKDMDRAAEGITVRLTPSANGVNLVAVGGKEGRGG